MLLCTQEFSQQTFADLTQTDFENVYSKRFGVANPCLFCFTKRSHVVTISSMGGTVV
jgi:hypothetical protein